MALSGFSGSNLPPKASKYLSMWLATTLVIPLPFLQEEQAQQTNDTTTGPFQSRKLLGIPEMSASVNVTEQQFLETFLFWFAVVALMIPVLVIAFSMVEEMCLTKCCHNKQELEELDPMVKYVNDPPSVALKALSRSCKVPRAGQFVSSQHAPYLCVDPGLCVAVPETANVDAGVLLRCVAFDYDQ